MLTLHRRIVIEKAAHALAKSFSGPRIQVDAIIQEMNIEFFPFEGRDGPSRQITGYYNCQAGKKDPPEIAVNLAKRETVQAMTMARLLGHHILHAQNAQIMKNGGIVLSRTKTSLDDPTVEEEGAFFARHLLVPTALYRNVRDAARAEIANIFGVPQWVIEARKGDTNAYYKLRYPGL